MYKFLGLNMKPGRKYTNTIEKPFFISGITIGEGENAELYVTHEKKTFLAAKVSKVIPQVPLDLYFSRDDKIVFKIKGDAMVSLVGHWYHTDSDEFDERSANKNKNGKKAFAQAEDDEEDDEDDDDDDGEEEEDEEEDDDDSRLIEKESFQENGEEDDEEDSDSDDEEEVAQPKAKVAKLSPEIIVKKGA